MAEITIDLSTFYNSNAKLSELDSYIQKAKALAGDGNDVVLTGQAPVWLYLKIAHALHGKTRKLIYRSPVTGDVVIFDHSPE
ncbi:MAG: CRISPR-associated protein Csx3 [Thermodesulfovibrionales bacterium]|nr:CRISPR-associated protein Csx3 [Thermodesulfovibrionales bacterium]